MTVHRAAVAAGPMDFMGVRYVEGAPEGAAPTPLVMANTTVTPERVLPAEEAAKVEAKVQEVEAEKDDDNPYKKHSREWERKAKASYAELEALRKKVQEHEDAGKSELERERAARERLEKQIAEAEAKAAEAVLAARRTELASEHIADDPERRKAFSDVLRGATAEELEAHAAALAVLLTPKEPEKRPKFGSDGPIDKSTNRGLDAGAAAYAAFIGKA